MTILSAQFDPLFLLSELFHNHYSYRNAEIAYRENAAMIYMTPCIVALWMHNAFMKKMIFCVSRTEVFENFTVSLLCLKDKIICIYK